MSSRRCGCSPTAVTSWPGQRVQTVNRLQRLLSELLPGQRKRDLSASQAKAMLATVRPRDIAGKTRRRMAAEEIADLVAVDAEAEEDQGRAQGRGHRPRVAPDGLHGVGPAGAARALADVGDVARFADRNRFASWTGTAPLDASSGEQNRHRLSRAGNRRMNHVLHVAAIVQIRHDTEGRAYYRRKLAAGKTPMEALRCLKRRLSDVVYRQLVADATAALKVRAREGTAGRLKNPARSTYPRKSTLRISHSRTRRKRDATPKITASKDRLQPPLDTEGNLLGWQRGPLRGVSGEFGRALCAVELELAGDIEQKIQEVSSGFGPVLSGLVESPEGCGDDAGVFVPVSGGSFAVGAEHLCCRGVAIREDGDRETRCVEFS